LSEKKAWGGEQEKREESQAGHVIRKKEEMGQERGI
jgi:hypothetical protein